MTLQDVISVDNMRQSDARAIAGGTPSRELMLRAARGIFNAVSFTGKTAVVCGSGNNGGDGYALACVLLERGFTPVIFRVTDRFSQDGLYYYRKAISMGAAEESLAVPAPLTGFDIVVDCILGTGFKGELGGEVLRAVELINSCSAYIISADINSGLNGDTGTAGVAVNSDLTVSIGSLKTGMFLNDAPYCIDRLRNADIGIPLVREEYKLMDYEMLRMFEGYNSVVMTEDEFYERFGLTPETADIAGTITRLSAEQKKTFVVKTRRSAVVADIRYTYFCADYIG